jgi:hypothetical protein
MGLVGQPGLAGEGQLKDRETKHQFFQSHPPHLPRVALLIIWIFTVHLHLSLKDTVTPKHGIAFWILWLGFLNNATKPHSFASKRQSIAVATPRARSQAARRMLSGEESHGKANQANS